MAVLRDVILRVGESEDPGALGSILAFLGVTETQGRGNLHLHGNGWGKVTADDITRYAEDGGTMEFIYELVNSLVTGEVDPEEVVPGWGEEVTHKKERVWYTNDIPTCAKDIPSDSSKLNSVVNHHGPKCVAACEPKRKKANSTCRMARPARPIHTSKVTEITLDETGLEFKLHRWILLLNRWTKIIASSFRFVSLVLFLTLCIFNNDKQCCKGRTGNIRMAGQAT